MKKMYGKFLKGTVAAFGLAAVLAVPSASAFAATNYVSNTQTTYIGNSVIGGSVSLISTSENVVVNKGGKDRTNVVLNENNSVLENSAILGDLTQYTEVKNKVVNKSAGKNQSGSSQTVIQNQKGEYVVNSAVLRDYTSISQTVNKVKNK